MLSNWRKKWSHRFPTPHYGSGYGGDLSGVATYMGLENKWFKFIRFACLQNNTFLTSAGAFCLWNGVANELVYEEINFA